MPKFLIRCEAVNLSNIISDTDDLSTRRGGGLLALNAHREITEFLKKQFPNPVKEIATGASIGLYEINSDENAVKNAVEKLRLMLSSTGTLEYPNIHDDTKTDHLPLKFATFVVDYKSIGATEQQTEQELVAANRWQQMQSPSVSFVGLWDQATAPCKVDMVRPANSGKRLPKHRDEKKSEQWDASESVYQRHLYGRQARQKFYQDETTLAGLQFTNEFSEVATHPKGNNYPINNKLALFYVDGNKFGDKGRAIFEKQNADGFQKWSEALRKHHRQLLCDLLGRAQKDAYWKNGDAIRIETLLWGGDEIIWVVPAWKGWELAEWFFSQKHLVNQKPVTYSGGLVFCNAKAPIQNIVNLAYRLADLAKKENADGTQHRLAYEVLESFDDIPGDLKAHRQRWLPESSKVEDLILDPKKLSWNTVRQVASAEEFPMRQLYRYCQAWRKAEAATMDKAKGRLHAALPAKTLEPIVNIPAGYLHLLQMLPYIPEFYAEIAQ